MSWRADAKPVSAPPGLDAPDRQRVRAAPKRGKSQIAIQVNQQLLRLDSTSEVREERGAGPNQNVAELFI